MIKTTKKAGPPYGRKEKWKVFIGTIKADGMDGRCRLYTERQKRGDRRVHQVFAINP